jgi:hypothetical protein
LFTREYLTFLTGVLITGGGKNFALFLESCFGGRFMGFQAKEDCESSESCRIERFYLESWKSTFSFA